MSEIIKGILAFVGGCILVVLVALLNPDIVIIKIALGLALLGVAYMLGVTKEKSPPSRR